MTSTPKYRAPAGWLRYRKYLFPVGTGLNFRARTKPPLEQVPIAQLACDFPDEVRLQTWGESEILPEFQYECVTDGRREPRTLPPRPTAPAFVARLEQGMSFGRHCCVISASNQAVRETGFHLDGDVRLKRQPLSPFRLQFWRKRWEGDVTARAWLPPKQRIEGRVAVLNTRCSHNFYHWLTDVLPRLVPLRKLGLEADYYLVDCLRPFQRDVLAALGISPTQLIQPHCRLLLQADELLFPSLPSPACLREFGRMFATGLQIDGPVQTTRRIFISRRKTAKRSLINEDELESQLAALGFETHCMEDYPLAKQARLIREAEIVVAMHGAGLGNLLFARPGTRVVEIIPAGRYNDTCFPKKSCIYGLRHQVVLAQPAGRRQLMSVNISDVAAAIENGQLFIQQRTAG